MNILELRPTRYKGFPLFYDYFIDGQNIVEHFTPAFPQWGDGLPPFNKLMGIFVVRYNEAHFKLHIKQLLKEPITKQDLLIAIKDLDVWDEESINYELSNLNKQSTPIYICRCGAYECGSIRAEIHKTKTEYTWYFEMGPIFRFEAKQYRKALNVVLK